VSFNIEYVNLKLKIINIHSILIILDSFYFGPQLNQSSNWCVTATLEILFFEIEITEEEKMKVKHSKLKSRRKLV